MSRLDGGRGTHSRRGDDLTKMRVRRLARREDSGFAGLHLIVNLYITEIVHLQLAFEHLRVRRVTDEDEHAIGFKDGLIAGLDILQSHRLDLFRADHFSHNRVHNEIHLGMFFGALLQERASAEFFAAMNDGHG